VRIVVVGATGNVGTSVLRALEADASVESVVGIARRLPAPDSGSKAEWAAADVVTDDLRPHFDGADAVVHLAWAIQPSRDESALRAINIGGTARVLAAVAEAGVPALVYASSVGAYSPGPKDRAVDESWPTEGIATSFYSRHKAETERMLDRFEQRNPSVRVARLRPALIFKGDAASEIRRLFAGPFLPTPLLRPGLIPVVPRIARLRFQAVHSLDVGEAYRAAVVNGEARGAFNVAADPVLDPDELADLLGARTVPVPAGAVRALTGMTWRLRLQPTPPGWVDMALGVPVMDSSRAREVLGWEPRRTAREALMELLEGMRKGRGAPTPTLDPDAGGPARTGEVLSGVGARQGVEDDQS
jgi:UDP-glucose 4-epimerase